MELIRTGVCREWGGDVISNEAASAKDWVRDLCENGKPKNIIHHTAGLTMTSGSPASQVFAQLIHQWRRGNLRNTSKQVGGYSLEMNLHPNEQGSVNTVSVNTVSVNTVS